MTTLTHALGFVKWSPIFRARTWSDLLPRKNEDSVVGYRTQLPKTPDYDPLEHNRRVVAGVTWLAEFRARPIPRHRALVLYKPQH
jgi:hypothetical protein